MSVAGVLQAVRRLRVQFALIVAVAMAPAGLVAVIQAASNIEDEIRQEEEGLRKVARRVTEDERGAILGIRERMRLAARNSSIKELGGERCDAAVARLHRDDPRFAGALLFNDKGVSVCGERKGFDISSTAAYRTFSQAPRLLVGPVRVGQLSGKNMLLALAPVLSEAGQTGILAMGLSADFFQSLAEKSEAGEVQFALLDDAGTVFAENMTETRDWLPLNISTLLQDDEVVAHLQARDGKRRIFYVAPLPIERIWMISAQPELTWQAVVFSEEGLALVTPLLLWAIAVSVAFFVIDRLVSRHIVYLQRVAAAIGRGHLDIGRLSLEGAPSEIKQLGDALENMSERLAEREAALRATVEAKQALLLEVHHRVKNNLQMISSLMNMQLRRVEGPAERRAIQIVQDRIHGLALVHQHLYAAERLDAIALDELVSELARYLSGSLCPPGGAAELDFDLEALEASADTATPVALFLTEAVANAFKHCWGPETRGRLSISLKHFGDDCFELVVRNDRPAGDPAAFSADTETVGLGTRLMEGFARQISGTVERRITAGRFSVTLRAPLSLANRSFMLRHRGREAAAQDDPGMTSGGGDGRSSPPKPIVAQ